MGVKEVKLKELLLVFRNGACIKQFEGAEGLPITRIETISDATINPLKVGYANIFDDKYQDYYLQEGDILLSHINSVTHLGKCAIYTNPIDKLIHGMNLLMLRANKDLILPKYLYYVLNSKQFKVQLPKITKKSVNQASMTVTDIGNLKLLIEEDLAQQQKVVEILDKADEIRAKKKLANDKLNEFLKSTFISIFGDPVKNDKGFDTTILQNIGSFKNGINYNAGDNGYSIKCIGVGDFKNGTILNSIDKLNSVEVNQTPNEEYFVRKNDIVFVRSNGSKELVGRTLLINTDLQENIVYSGFCIRLRVEQENINNMFLLQLLNTKPIKDNMKNDGHGCNIKSLNQTILGNIPVIIPPIEDQNKFAQIVEKVEAQKQKNELVIEQMNNLFNSLSQRAFKGEL